MMMMFGLLVLFGFLCMLEIVSADAKSYSKSCSTVNGNTICSTKEIKVSGATSASSSSASYASSGPSGSTQEVITAVEARDKDEKKRVRFGPDDEDVSYEGDIESAPVVEAGAFDIATWFPAFPSTLFPSPSTSNPETETTSQPQDDESVNCMEVISASGELICIGNEPTPQEGSESDVDDDEVPQEEDEISQDLSLLEEEVIRGIYDVCSKFGKETCDDILGRGY